MTTISKEFNFSASHRLLGLAPNHPCSNTHGHNYVLTAYFTGQVNEQGFIVDYRELDSIKNYIDSTLDHKHLNEVFPFSPTVENMSKHIFGIIKAMFPTLSAIEMSETPKTRCRYESN